MEFGLFLFLGLLGAIGFIRNRSLMFLILSTIIFFSLSAWLAAEPVTQKENSAANTIERNATGDIIITSSTNSTKTVAVITTDNIIVSYVLYMAAAASTFMLLLRLFIGGWTFI